MKPAPRARIGTMTRPPEVKGLEARSRRSKARKNARSKNQIFEARPQSRSEKNRPKKNLNPFCATGLDACERSASKWTRKTSFIRLSKWTGIRSTDGRGRNARLLQCRTPKWTGVVGQQRSRLCFVQGAAPSRADSKIRAAIGTFALLGPTGIGKTLLARRSAEQLFRAPRPHQLDIASIWRNSMCLA